MSGTSLSYGPVYPPSPSPTPTSFLPPSPQIVLALYAIATFGKWFSFLTLAYLAIVGALAWPPIYKKYQVEIDDVYSHGKKWIETQLAAVPGLIPKAEVAKKKQ